MKPKAAERAWIFTTTSPKEIFSSYSSIDPGRDLLVAADGGLERMAALELIPDVIIGDMDTASGELVERYRGVPVLRHPAAKNETDSELAVLWCLEGNVGEIVICNGLEGRFDHSCALLQNLAFIHGKGARGRIESEGQLLFFLNSETDLGVWKGCLLSLLAWTDEAKFSSSEGLEYPLENVVLSRLRPRGMSNRVLSGEARIKLLSGLVLAILTK